LLLQFLVHPFFMLVVEAAVHMAFLVLLAVQAVLVAAVQAPVVLLALLVLTAQQILAVEAVAQNIVVLVVLVEVQELLLFVTQDHNKLLAVL
jgi:hypothetical protein